MNEAQRQYYLKHCGITLWYSQTPLAGAAPSIEFEFPNEDTYGDLDSSNPARGSAERADVDQPDAPAAKQARATKAPGRLIGLVDQTRTRGEAVSERSQVEVPPKLEPDQPVSAEGTDAHGGFRFAVDLRIAPAEKLVLIAQIGSDLPVDVQEKLLMQISRALGQPAAADGLSDLVWPVFANRHVPGNDDAGLSAVLKHVLGPFKSRTWVGLGTDVEELMALVDEGDSGAGPRLAFTHGLNELAASAEFKRQFWHLIGGSTALAQLREKSLGSSVL